MQKKISDVTAVILAGGASKRFGEDKSGMKINDRYVLPEICSKLSSIFEEVIIVVKNRKQAERVSRLISSPNIKIIADKSRISSPLPGIKAAEKELKKDYFFLMACDMPFVERRVIMRLISKLKKGVSGVIAKTPRGLEPLCSIYQKGFYRNIGCNDRLKKAIFENIKKGDKIIIVPFKKTSAFANINTKEELRRIENLGKPGDYLELFKKKPDCDKKQGYAGKENRQVKGKLPRKKKISEV